MALKGGLEMKSIYTNHVDRKRNFLSPYNPLSCKKTGLNILLAIRPTPGRAHTRGERREAKICFLVEEAVTLLRGTRIRETNCDTRVWAAICRRVGPRKFAAALRQFVDEAKKRGKLPRRPASAFQSYLNKVFPKPSKGGAK
jgi:hypothetical protein